MSVDLPEPDGPMIAAKREPGKPTLTPDESVDGRLAFAVAAAEILGLDERREPFAAAEKSTGAQSTSTARPPSTNVLVGVSQVGSAPPSTSGSLPRVLRPMHETTPQVFLIARPSIDVEGMRGYLADVGGESWLERRLEEAESAPNGGELIVEFGGRACYRSWEPGLNPNVTKVRTDQREYFANILRSAHGSVLEHANYSFALRNVSRVFCYDAATEVLTEDGWKKWPDVDGSETFATVNPDSGALEYQKATEHFAGDYDGEMFRVRSEQVDLLVTPNHRMWVKAHDTQANKRGEEPYRVRLASEIFGKRVAYQKTANWEGAGRRHGARFQVPSASGRHKTALRIRHGTMSAQGSRSRSLLGFLATGSPREA